MLTKRQTFDKAEALLAGYMKFPHPMMAAVAALWAIGTWKFQEFDAYPYLVITALTKQAGKTRLMELTAMLSFNPEQGTAISSTGLYRPMSDSEGEGVTLFNDEAEPLSSEAAGTLRSVINAGYRRGAKVKRPKGDIMVEYDIYYPKCFVLIGSPYDTLRDRSINIELIRGLPARKFRFAEAEAEAAELKPALNHHRDNLLGEAEIVDPEWLEGRDAEVWSPILTLAKEWAPHRYDDLVRASVVFTSLKTVEARHYSKLAQEEDERIEESYGLRALRDLASVTTTPRISGQDACRLLCEIPTAPWQLFRGEPLTPIRLAQLVQRFGLASKQIKHGGKNLRGYQRADIERAISKLAK